MSLVIPTLNVFINRMAETLEASTTLFPTETTGKKIINKVLKFAPALEGSPDTTFMPYVFIAKSRGSPIRKISKAGRDTIDKAGGTLYEYEFYCVCVADALDISSAQEKAYDIAAPVQQAFEQNLRLVKPSDQTDPLCRTVETFLVPYLMSLKVANIQAVNVVVRPQVYVNLR